LQAAARWQNALEEKTQKLEKKAPKQATKQAKKEAKESANATKKAAKLASAFVPKLKLLAKAKKLVVVKQSDDGKKGTSWSVKSVLMRTTFTWAVCMPQRFNKNT
jgi:hypothetical protein